MFINSSTICNRKVMFGPYLIVFVKCLTVDEDNGLMLKPEVFNGNSSLDNSSFLGFLKKKLRRLTIHDDGISVQQKLVNVVDTGNLR